MKTTSRNQLLHISLRITVPPRTRKSYLRLLEDEALRKLVAWIREWGTLPGISVEVTLGDDELPAGRSERESTNRPPRVTALNEQQSEGDTRPIRARPLSSKCSHELCRAWIDSTGTLSPLEKTKLRRKLRMLEKRSKASRN